jgi:ankyrin repeat protein
MPDGDTTWPLHYFANAPGQRPRAAEIVTLLISDGADVDAPTIGAGHTETALHWAASNDDVELIDALLDAGADIEQPGSSIAGGSPLQSAVGYGQWRAARRLVERGARSEIWHAAGLGLVPLIIQALNTKPAPSADDLGGSLVNACDQGQMAAAKLLLAHGADLNWVTPWSGETALDRAIANGQNEIAAWLTEHGGRPGPTQHDC